MLITLIDLPSNHHPPSLHSPSNTTTTGAFASLVLSANFRLALSFLLSSVRRCQKSLAPALIPRAIPSLDNYFLSPDWLLAVKMLVHDGFVQIQ
ncbi:hypothetical protein K1719_025894 [Acacia pycnantha]|nr:hypothetical protein K1719_025894 [Acacia pycnantha]